MMARTSVDTASPRATLLKPAPPGPSASHRQYLPGRCPKKSRKKKDDRYETVSLLVVRGLLMNQDIINLFE